MPPLLRSLQDTHRSLAQLAKLPETERQEESEGNDGLLEARSENSCVDYKKVVVLKSSETPQVKVKCARADKQGLPGEAKIVSPPSLPPPLTCESIMWDVLCTNALPPTVSWVAGGGGGGGHFFQINRDF